jgi:hypothetical protein
MVRFNALTPDAFTLNDEPLTMPGNGRLNQLCHTA